MKVLIVSQYFWPENFRVNDLAEELQAKGHQVTVLTGRPNYPEGKVFKEFKENPQKFSSYAGAEIIRVPLISRGSTRLKLVLNYLSFVILPSILGPFKLRGKKFDSVFVFATSPITSAIPAILLGRLKKAPVLIWVLDLWPETLSAVGVLKNPKHLKLVGKVVSWIYNRTDYLLAQSMGFFPSIKKHCTREIEEERIIYFPSWAEDDFLKSSSDSFDMLEEDENNFTIVFAGNIGAAQDFPAILDAAEMAKDKLPIRWVIVGDGRMASWVKEQVKERKLNNVHLLGRHPLSKMPSLFSKADALLVSLRSDEVFSRTIPGKVQAYLAAGRPILAMIDGEAARVINESHAGLTCDSGDSEGLFKIARDMSEKTKDELDAMSVAGKDYYADNFAKSKILNRLESILENSSRRSKLEV